MALSGEYIQERFLHLLRREIGHTGSDPNNFELDKIISFDNLGDTYRVKCKECGTYQEQVMCDWSNSFKVDNLIEMMVNFSKSHRHPKPVGLTGEFEQPAAELPIRVFRY